MMRFIIDDIVNNNELMLTSGVWGIGELSYVPPSPYGEGGQVWMRSFKPFQIHNIDLTIMLNAANISKQANG